MALPWLGAAIGAGSSLLSGILGNSAQEKANAQSLSIAQQNMELQKQFAKNGIRWRAEDAKKAGIHPLYALGAQTTSYAPVAFSAGATDSLANSIGNMGQDLSRAAYATMTDEERAFQTATRSLTLRKMQLENDVLATEVASQRARMVQPGTGRAGAIVPVGTDAASFPDAGTHTRRPGPNQDLRLWGIPIYAPPTSSTGEEAEDALGEVGGSAFGLLTLPDWARYNAYRWGKKGYEYLGRHTGPAKRFHYTPTSPRRGLSYY